MAHVLEQIQTALAGRFRIERELGAGGMATVYLAEDLKHHRKVAVKVLRPELAVTLGAERFFREIEISAHLNHPHILPLFDSGKASGFLYYVMPFVEGESLRHRLNRQKQLPIDDVIKIAGEVADALDAAHERGVIHRDIKPENILLEKNHAVVADFGIARAIDVAGRERLTETGLAMGTPAYMSPEQAAGEKDVDGRSDIYALGCVVYEMLAGHPPFTGGKVQEILARHSLDAVPLLSAARPTVGPGLERAITTALAKTPADRFSTATQFADALGQAERPALLTAKRSPLRTWRAGLGLVLGLAIVAGAGWWLLGTGATTDSIRRLAVLPPDNLTDAGETAYWIEGVHEALISELGRVLAANVDVMGRRSVMQYRGSLKPVPVIARELDVDALIESTVLTVRDSVQVTVRLTGASPERQIWSSTFKRSLADILDIYGDVATAIAGELSLQIVTNTSSRVVDPDAYDAFLLGTHYQNRLLRIEPDLMRAISFFQSALNEDPGYAPAFAGIAQAWALLGWANIVSPDSAWPRLQKAADRAKSLNPDLAEVRTTAGQVERFLNWDWAAAETEFSTAIDFNPNDVDALAEYSLLLSVLSSHDRAIELARRARRLEPLEPMFQLRVVWALGQSGRFSEAMREIRELREAVPGFGLVPWFESYLLAREGRYADAIPPMQAAIDLLAEDDLGDEHSLLGFLYGKVGQEEQAREQDRALKRIEATGRYVSPVAKAFLHVGLREYDEAMRLLEEGYRTRAAWMPFLPMWREWVKPLEEREDFQDLLARMQFPNWGEEP